MKKKQKNDFFSQFDTTNIDTMDIDVTADIIDVKTVQTVSKPKPKPKPKPKKNIGGSQQVEIPSEIGVLALRNAVVFPGTVMPLAVGRPRSQKLLDAVLPEDKVLGVLTQKNPQTDDPQGNDLYPVGVIVNVLKMLKMPDGQNSLVVHGLVRFRVVKWLGIDPYLRAQIEVVDTKAEMNQELEAVTNNIRQMAQQIVELAPNIPEEVSVVINNIEDPGALADFLAANINISVETKQKILESLDIPDRLQKLSLVLVNQIELLELSDKIQSKVNRSIDKTQREYFLQEQLKVIQAELGQTDQKTADIDELQGKIEKAQMPEKVNTEAERELDRLSKIPTMSPEFSILRSYIEWLCELPWSVSTTDKLDISSARRILNQDHYDLVKIKKRILEFLAVRKLNPNGKSPILCLAGPPGVGKTSLGKSIARSMGRKFSRISLGGIRDEADIRGHRRTYIGALPGRIIQELRKCGSNNPVFMLDEIDKIGNDFRGDPASALLEVLDPEQNDSFTDHYIDQPFDLSKVMFIATANYMGTVPHALRDRMEVLELTGYTADDKLKIAKKYLLPRQLKENGLTTSMLKVKDDALKKIILSYTREAGVRNLDRKISGVCRAIAAEIAENKRKSATVSAATVSKYLGPVLFESELALRTGIPGVVTGLAYTPVGGEILFIETTITPGSGKLILTGQLGDVMKESAQTALTVLKSTVANSKKLKKHSALADLAERFEKDKSLQKKDIHIHVPAGAVPKDGPSAGVAMFTALASLLTDRAVNPKLAMTGEITLRGLVMPIGGVKEKVLAAKQAGITTVILPERNRKDLHELPKNAQSGMKFYFAKNVDQVLKIALDS